MPKSIFDKSMEDPKFKAVYEKIAAQMDKSEEKAKQAYLKKHRGSGFDDFLREEGIYEEVVIAAKKCADSLWAFLDGIYNNYCNDIHVCLN